MVCERKRRSYTLRCLLIKRLNPGIAGDRSGVAAPAAWRTEIGHLRRLVASIVGGLPRHHQADTPVERRFDVGDKFPPCTVGVPLYDG